MLLTPPRTLPTTLLTLPRTLALLLLMLPRPLLTLHPTLLPLPRNR